MTYSQGIEFLYGLGSFGIKPGLETTLKLAALSGSPHRSLRFIHVAGTNGKGSTCAMLECIYRTAGLRVGLFTSPHLCTFRERIQVDRVMISEDDAARWIAELRAQCAEFPDGAHPTFFELVTVMALGYFAEQKCDLVILETGLGGRLDSTNIVTPLASVITNVQMDHQQWLGSTLREIALEKAGIIKEGVPVVTGAADPEVFAVLADVARRKASRLIRVGESDARTLPIRELPFPLMGDHQLINAAVALATVEVVSPLIPVPARAADAALQQVQWPGRFQVVRPGIGRAVVLDCAHNPAGAVTLRSALQKQFGSVLVTLVFGVMKDKEWTEMFKILVPLAGRICLTSIRSNRAVDPLVLREHCQQINPYAEVLVCADAADALRQCTNDSLVVVTGSVFLVGEAMEALGLSASQASERGLNDTSPRP
jgi:dihydrofolate synthase / folylpolyglutamate synthase